MHLIRYNVFSYCVSAEHLKVHWQPSVTKHVTDTPVQAEVALPAGGDYTVKPRCRSKTHMKYIQKP